MTGVSMRKRLREAVAMTADTIIEGWVDAAARVILGLTAEQLREFELHRRRGKLARQRARTRAAAGRRLP
jgi:hypothetical protein